MSIVDEGPEDVCPALGAWVRWRRDGEGPGYLFSERTGGVFGLNRTAAAILEGLVRGEDRPALVHRLVLGFDVDRDEAARDVSAFIAALEEAWLVRR